MTDINNQILVMEKQLTDQERRLKKARLFLNKNFPLGWGMKWRNYNTEVKSLSRILK